MKGRRVRLTDAGVGKLKPHTTEYAVWDSEVPGLGVRVWKAQTLEVNRRYLRNQILPCFAGRQVADIDNRFLGEVYLPLHNARFATPAEGQGSAFVPFAGALDEILCVHADRVVGNDNTVRYRGLSLQIPPGRHRHHYVKARVRVHEYPDGTLALFHGPRCLARYSADGEPIVGDGIKVRVFAAVLQLDVAGR